MRSSSSDGAAHSTIDFAARVAGRREAALKGSRSEDVERRHGATVRESMNALSNGPAGSEVPSALAVVAARLNARSSHVFVRCSYVFIRFPYVFIRFAYVFIRFSHVLARCSYAFIRFLYVFIRFS